MQTEISPASPSDTENLLDIQDVCKFWGGNRPTHPSTIYRQIAAGIHPKPIKAGVNLSRWIPSELRAERQRRMDAR